MDVKDLRTEAALSERNNDGSKYSQSVVALQCNRNKSYQDIGCNAAGKAEVAPVRPCAVIGPDRVVPPPASNDTFLKKGSVEPWPSPDNAYRRPPEYPHRLSNANPTRNISPRQTFQENMQRINVPPTYNAVRHSDSANYNHIQDRNVSISKNAKPNMAPEAKYCDVPYANSLANEHKAFREPEMYMQSVNPSLTRTAAHVWPPGSVNVAAPIPYSASDPYQYQQYSNCANQRPIIPVARPHKTIQEDAAYVYPEHYYPDANVRFKPFPQVRERYPQPRYEYLGNYPGQFNPSQPIQPPKYDISKSGQNRPFPVYPHLKYLENRIPEPTTESYQRQINHQPHYNIPFRNQAIHPPYGQVLGNAPQKVHPYPPEASIKPVASNKLHYENNTKMYIDQENALSKPYPVADNYFVNEMNRYQVKTPMAMQNYSPLGMRALPPHQYYIKDNPQMRSFDYMPHFRNYEPHLSANSVLRHAPQFSPNTLAISPTDSITSNDTLQTHGTSQEDCGYVSQSSTASVRSMDSGIYRLPHEFYKKPEYKYGPVVGSSPTLPKTDVNSKDNQKQMNVRQFLSMWNEGEEENPESSNSKEIVIQTGSSETMNYTKHHANNQDQLYVLGLENVPSEELSKYEHIEKISKLPENIKGYNNLELYSRFEEAMESCNTNLKATPKEIPSKDLLNKMIVAPLPRPVSPLDVEAKISQSVIHKEVGCNFEIRPCTPKMLNVEVAAPALNVLGERLIEKVTNPLSKTIKSPLPPKSDEILNCHTIKKQENSFAITDNPSCKMTCSPYSTNNIEPIKASYSLQDFNSGVCLASLPQLDNEIEMNFPEVNQQFINANKGDCRSPADINYKVQQTESGLPDNEKNETDLNEKSNLIGDSEKASNKLSKYRKLKSRAEKVLRTDSVIIKNPENIKNIEDKLLENNFNPTNLCSPINLSSQSSQWHNSSEPRENKDTEMALDFSLNRPANDLPIIDFEKDMVNKPFQTHNLSLETELQNKHVSSPDTINFSKENTKEANEVVTQCITNVLKNQEYHEPESQCSPEINVASISNQDNLLSNPNNSQKSNGKWQDLKEDVTVILEKRESIVPTQLYTARTHLSTVETDLTTNEEKDWLGTDKRTPHTETTCVKYCEDEKNNSCSDQCHKMEEIESDFEHDEISANLEKLFRDSDDDLAKSEQTKYSNTAEISSNSSIANTPESIDSKAVSKRSCNINKELFSPWMQKLLTYNEGFCPLSNNTPVYNNLCENEMINHENEVGYPETLKPASVDPNANVLIADVMPASPINPQSSVNKRPTEVFPREITKRCDTKKIKKICIKTISGNSSSKSYVIDTSKKEAKKRKKRLHKSKSRNKSQLNEVAKCIDELQLEPQIKPTRELNHEITSDATIEQTKMMISNASRSESKDFAPNNVEPNQCKYQESENISDKVIDISVVSQNPLNLENVANEISLTENYSKILTYCNTPEDEEQNFTHDDSNENHLEINSDSNKSIQNDFTDSQTTENYSKILTYCNTPDNEEQKSTRDDNNENHHENYLDSKISIQNDPTEPRITGNYSKILTYCNTPDHENHKSTHDDNNENHHEKDLESHKTIRNYCTDSRIPTPISLSVIDGDKDSYKVSCSPEERLDNVAQESYLSRSTSCESRIMTSTVILEHYVPPSITSASCETVLDSHPESKNLEHQETKKVQNDRINECSSSLCTGHSKNSLNEEIKPQEISDKELSCKDEISKPLHSNTTTNDLRDSPIHDQNIDSSCATCDNSLLGIPNRSLDIAIKELNMSDQNYSPKDESNFNETNKLIANEDLKESVTPLINMASEPLSFDKSLDKPNEKINTSDRNESCTEEYSNHLITSEELNESALVTPPINLKECIIDNNEKIRECEVVTEVETVVCDKISDAQVGKVNKQNINEEEKMPNNQNIIDNKDQPINVLESSLKDSADIVDESHADSSENNQHNTISAKDSNVVLQSECENSTLNLHKTDFIDTVVNNAQPHKEIAVVDDKMLTENETCITIPEVLLLRLGIDKKSISNSGVVMENRCELRFENSALNNLDKYGSGEVNKNILALETEFDRDIHTGLSSECVIETETIEVPDHKDVLNDYTTPDQMNKSTHEMLRIEKELPVQNNDLNKSLSSDLEKCERERNNTMLECKTVDDLSNIPDSLSDKWIEDDEPSPNRHIFSEEDLILYDNSEENLCYPVVNTSLIDMENETCIIPDTCIQQAPVKSRIALKRSYSDSALNSIKTRDTSERQMLDNTPMWPPKRQKMYQFNQTEQHNMINENICNFIHNSRRNSFSSYYNAENVSFCILIDNDCILTDENDEDKICFAEVADDCITETNTLEDNIEEIACSDETEINLSDSVVLDYNDKSIQEAWLDDVACVETVVSDDIIEETSNEYVNSGQEQSGVFNSYLNDPSNVYNNEYEDNIPANGSEMENVYKSPYEDDDEFHDREPLNPGNSMNENEITVSYSENCSPTSDYTSSFCISNNGNESEMPEDKENLYEIKSNLQDFESNLNHINNTPNLEINCSTRNQRENSSNQHSEEVFLPESSMDNVLFNYNRKEDEDETSYSPTSSSPEVSSTTSEDKSSSILLKITNYNGSRVSEVNEVNRNRPRCKFTESKDYTHSQENFPKRPLMTKAARKYIPPLKESIRDLKVQLPLPQQRLLKLKQLKLAKTEPKVVKQISHTVTKKLKPNFEDVLKSIDEVQMKMHKEKNKKTKNIVPKVVIKKNTNGSHYASSSSKQSVDPDLTGRKWQPWVFLEKNNFIDNMAIRNRRKAIFNHRKNTYVLAEKFQKYKSASTCNPKFVISQPNFGDSSKGHLKYTIRLKHVY